MDERERNTHLIILSLRVLYSPDGGVYFVRYHITLASISELVIYLRTSPPCPSMGSGTCGVKLHEIEIRPPA
jgi:hypothetical protein